MPVTATYPRLSSEWLKHETDPQMGRKVITLVSGAGNLPTGTVLGKDGFCQSCHEYAAVKLDCWDCHQPKTGQKTAAGVKP